MNEDEKVGYRRVFSAEHRVFRVRLVMALSVVFFLLMMLLSWQLIPMWHSGLEPNGEPISRFEVLALGIVCHVFGWGFLVGMHLYSRCYVVAIFKAPDGSSRIFNTVGWFRPVSYFVSADEEQAARFHRGRTRGFYSASMDVHVMEVDAPYYTQRLSSRRLPFIIDYHGVTLE